MLAVTRLQEAYVRKVIDTLNDLDNVLYEITNETAIFSRDWQYHMIKYIKDYQATKPKQHPVGMTAFDSGREGSMEALFGGKCHWISPQNDGASGDYVNDPPAADGRKVIISDTDHLWGVGGDQIWVWKSLTRGYHPIYMDPLHKPDWVRSSEAEMEGARKAMGDTRRFAELMNLAAMAPRNELSSTRYCLASPGKEYLVYLPDGGEVTVDLREAQGILAVEWMHPIEGSVTPGGTIEGGAKRVFKSPFNRDAALHLHLSERTSQNVSTEESKPAPAKGPLRVHPRNPRYFTDGSGKAVYLTGSHTWGNLCDSRERWPAFDFAGYLDFLERYHHNFIRLWSGDGLGHQPVPYARTGPGTAKDGGLKVDLDRFDPAFFDRLRSRVVAARDRGVYVGIMLFSPDSGAKREDWDHLLYYPTNNVQGINADTNKDSSGAEAYDLSIPRITAYQEAFVRKVVDTVNDLDNVLYEIGNEGDLTSVPWQYHFIRLIQRYEASKPKQHPVGMTAVFNILNGTWATDNRVLLQSPAYWISPGLDPYKDNPPAADGTKIIIADVDHIWPTAPHRGWIWECLLRGIHPILMDWYNYGDPTWTSSAEQEAVRKYMGYAMTYAKKMELAAMTPQNELSGTGYCLANPGVEYLVYQPAPGVAFTVDLHADTYDYEWFDPGSGTVNAEGSFVAAGGTRSFTAPFNGDAVLHIRKQ